MTLPLVYIAGPITKPDPIVNTHEALLVADELYCAGVCAPLIPHMNMVWHLVRPHETQFWYEYDMHVLAKCDALLRLLGPSVGADLEIVEAHRLGLPVFTWGNDDERCQFMDWCAGDRTN